MGVENYDDLDIKLVIRKMANGLILDDDDKLVIYNTNTGLVNHETFKMLFKVILDLKEQIKELAKNKK